MIEEKIYEKLEELNILDALKEIDYLKINNPPFMPLSIEKLYEDEKDGKKVIVLAHYFEQNGDLVPDPDMEIEVDEKNKKARVLTFQSMYVYQEVTSNNPKLQSELNIFLIEWLENIESQRYKIEATASKN